MERSCGVAGVALVISAMASKRKSDPDVSFTTMEGDVESASENPPNSSERGAIKDGKTSRKSRQSSGNDKIIKELRRTESALSASI